jgi:retron-type reverse transcriptase
MFIIFEPSNKTIINMNEELRHLLKNILVKKMFVKNALENYRKMMNLTGFNYNKEINDLLDELNTLDKLEKELEKRK